MLDPTLAAGLATFLVAAAGWLTGLVNKRTLKAKTIEDRANHIHIETLQVAVQADVRAIHVMVNDNWSRQMTAHNAAIAAHAAALHANAQVIDRLMLQSATSALTAEAVRRDHDQTLRASLDALVEQGRLAPLDPAAGPAPADP